MRRECWLNFTYYQKCITRHLLCNKNSSLKIEYILMVYLPGPVVFHWVIVDKFELHMA